MPAKFVEPGRFTDPHAAARRLVEIANATEAVHDGRIYIELVNGRFLSDGGTPDQSRDFASVALGRLAAWIAGDDWPG
jgi:hypothetical protein